MLSLETTMPQSSSLKTKIGAAVAATAAIGVVAAVALTSSSVTTQSTGLFNIPEDFKGHFSGGEVSGVWTVQGKFHKFNSADGDWQIDSVLTMDFADDVSGSQVFTLKDNVLTVVRHLTPGSEETELECGSRDRVPGYGLWANLLQDASVVSSDEMSQDVTEQVTKNCPAGADAVMVNMEGRQYIVCADNVANTRAMYAFDDTFSFSAVSRPGMTVNIEQPTGFEKLNCSTFDPTKDRYETSENVEVQRELAVGDGDGNGSSGYNSRGPLLAEGKNCAFYHGVGGRGTHGKYMQASHKYWGLNAASSGVARYCANTKLFLVTDSFNRGYAVQAYHDEVCYSLHQGYNIINAKAPGNMVVFTHSMGGLTTRKAFQETCTWTGAYFQSEAPMSGSKSANFAHNACVALTAIPIVGWLIKALALGPYCKSWYMGAATGYKSIYDGLPVFNKTQAKKRADGRVCGTSSGGYKIGAWMALVVIGKSSGLQTKLKCVAYGKTCGWRGCTPNNICLRWKRKAHHDGMVPWNACAVNWRSAPGQTTSITAMAINHADGTGRYGSTTGGPNDIYRWFQNRS